MSILSSTSSIILSSDSPIMSLFYPGYVDNVTVSYQKPLYENLNSDPKVHRMMIKHYYYRVLDDWLMNDLIDILGYIKMENNKASLISSLSQFNPNAPLKESIETLEKKVDFIEENIFKRKHMSSILYKFIMETGVNWYDLSKNEYFLRQVVRKNLERKFKKIID